MASTDFSQRIQSEDDWMSDGACLGLTGIFFPVVAERPQTRERREEMARGICAQCVVLEKCRSFARDNHEYGFWGGESEEERHAAGFRLIAPIGVRSLSRR
ncbi:MAG: WhiB family transcriptional regulator [Actinobacteria bacterium]|nr:MAG: WhiB family transcriptional regulator [Actinomycetota bacterium]